MALALSRMLGVSGPFLNAALFGFFYAWVCSTMWGLDGADPRIAISAMQATNGAVRNVVFAPAFFATGPVLVLAAILAVLAGHRAAAALLAASGLIVLGLATLLTMLVNLPMNEALALVEVPQDLAAAQAIWQDYSPRWQFWNQIRTVTSGIGFLVALAGLVMLFRPGRP